MASQTFTLKVSLSKSCQLKAKSKLERIEGVDSVSVKEDLVTISGTINPSVAIRKFADWRKTAVLLSVVKDHDTDDNNNNNNNSDSDTICDKKRRCSKSVAKDSRHQTHHHQQQQSSTVLHVQGKNKSRLSWFGKKLGNLINPWHYKSSPDLGGFFSPKKWSLPSTPRQQEYGASTSPFGNQFFQYEQLPQHTPYPVAPPSMAYQPMPPQTSYTGNYWPWSG